MSQESRNLRNPQNPDPATADIHGRGRILLHIPYWRGEGQEYAKRIPGGSPLWKKGTGTQRDRFQGYTYPLDIEILRTMRRTLPRGSLVLGAALKEWAAAEYAIEADLNEIRNRPGHENLALLTRTRRIAPQLWEAMSSRDFQATGALFAARGRQVMISDQPGLGKTLETLSALVECDVRTVAIFCRKTARVTVWQREIERWLGEAAVSTVIEGTREQREHNLDLYSMLCTMTFPGIRFLIMNSEMARMVKQCPNGKPIEMCKKQCEHERRPTYKTVPVWPQLFKMPAFDAIVVDEAHRVISGSKSTRSASVSQVRLGMVKLPCTPGTVKIALSGTPMRGNNTNSWGVLNWLRPSVFGSYWTYIKHFFENGEVDGERGTEIIVGDVRAAREKAYDRQLQRYMIRRTKAEVAPDMPEKDYAGTPLEPGKPDRLLGVWLPMTPAQERVYAQMEANGDAEVDGGRLTTDGALAEMTRLRQFASTAGRLSDDKRFLPSTESNKLAWLLDFLDEAEGCKVVIASQFTQIISLFEREVSRVLKYPVISLTGETSDRMRAQVQDWFQDPYSGINVIFVNTIAGGESINLSEAQYMVFLDETWIPDEQEQMEDRGHRIGNATGLTVYYLRSLGSIEEDIARVTGMRAGAVRRRLDAPVAFRASVTRSRA